jgi:putative oxidoreductase
MQAIFRHLVLITRVVIGGILTAHGYQKVFLVGLDGTADSFLRMGWPLPHITAAFAGIVELAGGLALVIGLLLPLAAILIALDMLGAFIFVHAKHGIFIADNGVELVVALGLAALLVGFSGGGTVALDRLLFRGSRRRTTP